MLGKPSPLTKTEIDDCLQIMIVGQPHFYLEKQGIFGSPLTPEKVEFVTD